MRAAKKQKHSHVLVPELMELIAKFLPTSTDMIKFLRAIPTLYLTDALATLERMMLIKTPNDIDFYRKWLCPMQINRNLWPKFPLNPLGRHGCAVDSIDAIYSLYSHAHTNPSPATQPYTCFEIPSGHLIPSVNGSLDVCMNPCSTLKNIKMQYPASSSKFMGIADFVKKAKSFTELTELDLSKHIIREYDKDFFEDLSILANKVKSLKVYVREVSKPFLNHFRRLPRQLLNARSLRMKMSYGQLTGIHLETSITKIIHYIDGQNLTYVNLEIYDLQFPDDTKACELFKILGQMTNLRILGINGLEINPTCCVLLAKIIPQLQECHLYGNQINDFGGRLLAQALPNCTRLEHLSFSQQIITDATAIAFATSIAQGLPIRTLDLSQNYIGKDGVIALSHVIPRLEALKLIDHKFGKQGALILDKVIREEYLTMIKPENKALFDKNDCNPMQSYHTFCSKYQLRYREEYSDEPILTESAIDTYLSDFFKGHEIFLYDNYYPYIAHNFPVHENLWRLTHVPHSPKSNSEGWRGIIRNLLNWDDYHFAILGDQE